MTDRGLEKNQECKFNTRFCVPLNPPKGGKFANIPWRKQDGKRSSERIDSMTIVVLEGKESDRAEEILEDITSQRVEDEDEFSPTRECLVERIRRSDFKTCLPGSRKRPRLPCC